MLEYPPRISKDVLLPQNHYREQIPVVVVLQFTPKYIVLKLHLHSKETQTQSYCILKLLVLSVPNGSFVWFHTRIDGGIAQ